MSQRPRPAGITLLVILEIVVGLLLLLGAVGGRYQAMRYTRLGGGSGSIILLILAVLNFVLAYGFWAGKAWAWVGGIVLVAFGIIVSVFSLFLRPTIGEVIYLFLNLMMIYLLMQPRIQKDSGRSMIKNR